MKEKNRDPETEKLDDKAKSKLHANWEKRLKKGDEQGRMQEMVEARGRRRGLNRSIRAQTKTWRIQLHTVSIGSRKKR